MADKIYCGSGKVIETKYGKMLKLSFREEDIDILRQNLDNGWVNVNVGKKKSPEDGKSTHYLTIDTWKPERSNTNGSKYDSNNRPSLYPPPSDDDDLNLPF